MKLLKKYLGEVKNNQLIIYQHDLLNKQLKNLNGKKVALTIRQLTASRERSEQQNKYYWGVVLKIISEETGNSPQDLHDYYKNKYLSGSKEVFFEKISFCHSTTKLSYKKFSEYLEKIKNEVALPQPEGMGIYIPDVDEIQLEW